MEALIPARAPAPREHAAPAAEAGAEAGAPGAGVAADERAAGAEPRSAPLPASALHTPPPSLRVCRVELAIGTLPGGLVVARGALAHDVPSTQSGLLLLHPGGAWLVDGGMSADFGAYLH